MTSENREKSWEDGEPVEFYDFIRGTTHWRYNTSDRVLPLNGFDWAPLNVERERIQQGSERNRLTLEIRVPRDATVVANWEPSPASAPVGLTVYGAHIGEADALVVWIGRVVQPKFSTTQVKLLGEPTTTLSKKAGQLQSWQRGCMHVLYKQGDGLCNVIKEDFAVPATISAAAGASITAPEFGVFAAVFGNRLAGGFLEWENAFGVLERRSINAHSGDTVELFFGSGELLPTTNVTAYPGCAHDWIDCNDFFNNGPNYGGDLYAPERSPFNGQPVF